MSTLASYMTSRKNLAGSALGLLGVGLSIGGVVTGILPAVGVIAGLYAAGALAVPEARDTFDPGGDAGIDVAATAKQLKKLSGIAATAPPEIAAKAQGIITAINELLPRLAGKSESSEEVYVVSRMATNYLPDTLDAYLRLPRAYASTQKLAGGVTAEQLVIQQLALLSQKLTEVTNAILKGDSDALAAHGRFLEERFAPSALQVSSSGPIPPAPPASSPVT